MPTTPLILALTVLTALTLTLLILWVVLRYAREQRTRHRRVAGQINLDAAVAVERADSARGCVYLPSGAPQEVDGFELGGVRGRGDALAVVREEEVRVMGTETGRG